MEMHAYYEGYLSNAQDTLGNMMDYAVNSCNMDAEDIFTMFLFSGAARQFEKGNPRYVAGMSGAELAKEAVLRITGKELTGPEEYYIDKSPEYWCGWILAYYQWRTGRSFKKICQTVSVKEILCMYPTHHEADEERFVDTINHIFAKKHTKSYMQQIREKLNMSIEELAEQTGIDEAVLDDVEKNFSKVNSLDAAAVYRLSKILGCGMEDLIEV